MLPCSIMQGTGLKAPWQLSAAVRSLQHSKPVFSRLYATLQPAAPEYGIVSKLRKTPPRVFIDKTRFLPYLLSFNFVKVFRPPRFGKTTMLEHIRDLCTGRRDLFPDTDLTNPDSRLFDELMKMGYNDVPCLSMDFSNIRDPSDIDQKLADQMKQITASLNITRQPNQSAASLLYEVLETLKDSGKQIVILIDEVDTPIVYAFTHMEVKAMSSAIGNFLHVLKGNHAIKFCMLTGLYNLPFYSSRQTNQFFDLSSNPKFADAWGFTESEVKDMLKKHYENDGKREEKLAIGLTFLKNHCNGYRFTLPNPDQPSSMLYHPWQAINYLENEYSAVPEIQFLPGEELPKQLVVDLSQSMRIKLHEETVLSNEDSPEVWTLANELTNCGLLSKISSKREKNRILTTLKMPNRRNLMRVLAAFNPLITTHADNIKTCMYLMDIARLEQSLNDFFSIQKSPILDTERTLQSIVEAVFNMCSLKSMLEVVVGGGTRCDLVVTTPKAFYVIEVKFEKKNRPQQVQKTQEQPGSTAVRNALKQIVEKNYYRSVRNAAKAEKKEIIEMALVYWKLEERCIELAAQSVNLEAVDKGDEHARTLLYPRAK